MPVPIQSNGVRSRLPILILALAVSIGVANLAPAAAHELRPVIVAAEIDRSGTVELRIALNLEAHIAGIGPEDTNTSDSANAPLYDRLRGFAPNDLRARFAPLADEFAGHLHLTFGGVDSDLVVQSAEIPPVGDVSVSRISTLILAGSAPADVAEAVWTADREIGDTVFRVSRAGDVEPFFSAFLRAGEPSEQIALNGLVDQRQWRRFVDYVAIGFEHIVPMGLDHILFVIGLFLLSLRLRVLWWQITAFTLAHSVTLALGIYGLVKVPATIVEPLIAASIAFVAIENLFTDRLRRWRPFVIFAFGLLHGLGFADVLSEVGLPSADFVTALVGFNVGVELGQLAVIAACFLAVGLWFRDRRWYRHAIAMPASVAIACVAIYWMVERTA